MMTHVKVYHLEHAQFCPCVSETMIVVDERVTLWGWIDGLDVDDRYSGGVQDVTTILGQVDGGHNDKWVF